MRIFALLDRDTAIGYRLVGVKVRVLSLQENIKPIVREYLSLPEAGIIIIGDVFAKKAADILQEHISTGKAPLVVEVPLLSSGGIERKSIEEIIKDSIGIAL